MLSDNLPEDLMIEIIVRLPSKSLLRFKCVSKSWYALITDHSFITKQLKRSNSINKNRRLKLMFKPPNQLCLMSNSKEQPYEIQNLESPFPNKNDLTWILAYGQCNGIFCLSGDYEGDVLRCLILWNPTTKEVKIIPPSQWQPKEGIYFARIGLGFDHITKDYKVVRFPICPVREKKQPPLVEVYNLSTNSWRKLDDVDVPIFEFRHSPKGPYLNGAYHWFTHDRDKNDRFILSFDFSKEAFGIIQSPPGIVTFSRPENNHLYLVDESLAWVVAHVSIEFRVEIWVMNEYGVESSWVKKFEIRPFPYFPYVVEFWGDNKILINDDINCRLISCNLRNQQRQMLQNPFHTLPIMDYVESLFPLGGNGKHTRI